MDPQQRKWSPDWPCPVDLIWGGAKPGLGPTHRIINGQHWRAWRTTAGPVTLAVRQAGPKAIHAQAWGPGSAVALTELPELLGAADDPSAFRPEQPLLRELQRRFAGLRIGRVPTVWEALLPTIIEQKVTGQEAAIGLGALRSRYGEAAPGPGSELGLRLLPTPEVVRKIPSWDWLAMSVDPARSRTAVRVAGVADTLERVLPAEPERAEARLRSLPGVGVWTSAEVRAQALGDADAVSFGDYHIARNIGWALLGRIIDDAELATLLEPYRPHRYRVQQLIQLSGIHPPRRGPRLAPRTHLRGRS